MSTTRTQLQQAPPEKRRKHVRMGTFGPWSPEIYDGMFPSPDYPPSKNWDTASRRSSRTNLKSDHYSASTSRTDGAHVPSSIQEPSQESPRRGTFGVADDVRFSSKDTVSQGSRSQAMLSQSRSRTSSQISDRSTLTRQATSIPQPQRSTDSLSTSSTASSSQRSEGRNTLNYHSLTPSSSPHTPSKSPLRQTSRIRPTVVPDGPRSRIPAASFPVERSISQPQAHSDVKLQSPSELVRAKSLSTSIPPLQPILSPKPLLPEASSSRQHASFRPLPPTTVPEASTSTLLISHPKPPPTPPKSPKRSLGVYRSAIQSRPSSLSSPADPPSFVNPFASSRPSPSPRLDTSSPLSKPSASGPSPFEATSPQSPSSNLTPRQASDIPIFTNPFGSSSPSPRRSKVRMSLDPASMKSTPPPSSRSPISPTFPSPNLSFSSSSTSSSSLASPTTPTSGVFPPRRTSLQPIPADLGASTAYRKTSLPNLDTISEGLPSQYPGQHPSLGWSGVASPPRSPVFQERRVDLRKWSQKIDPGRDS